MQKRSGAATPNIRPARRICRGRGAVGGQEPAEEPRIDVPRVGADQVQVLAEDGIVILAGLEVQLVRAQDVKQAPGRPKRKPRRL